MRVQDIEIKQDMDFEDFLLRVNDEFERDVVFDYECGGALVRVERPRCVFKRVYVVCVCADACALRVCFLHRHIRSL